LKIDFAHTWRRGESGYDGGCTHADVADQVVSDVVANSDCWTLPVENFDWCGYSDNRYQVTFVEDQLPVENYQYCYGEGTNSLDKTALTGKQ